MNNYFDKKLSLYRRIHTLPKCEAEKVRLEFYELARKTVYLNLQRSPDLIAENPQRGVYWDQNIEKVKD